MISVCVPHLYHPQPLPQICSTR
uniref:Uncharacterized protein n=1 Tax=Arundo donax TaxID=35708 RepID=A0A0A9FTL9_ARUDO